MKADGPNGIRTRLSARPATSISAADATPHGLQPFPCSERDHPQPSEWISPPPPPRSVAAEAREEDHRQGSAHSRLSSRRFEAVSRQTQRSELCLWRDEPPDRRVVSAPLMGNPLSVKQHAYPLNREVAHLPPTSRLESSALIDQPEGCCYPDLVAATPRPSPGDSVNTGALTRERWRLGGPTPQAYPPWPAPSR